jgi:hypothetical protein
MLLPKLRFSFVDFDYILMKNIFSSKLALIASLVLCGLSLNPPAKASEFTETQIDQTQVIAIARPYGDQKYDLLVIEQIPKKRQCWAESGSMPVMVDPLLLNYDFTGICRRSTDSNGYSVRLDGQDYGLEYLLRLVPRGNELVLVGTPRKDKNAPELVIGSTQGLQAGFMKIILKPGWQFSKRTYNNKVLGHFYFSGKQADVLNPSNVAPQLPAALPASIPPSVPMPDPGTTPIPSVPEGLPSTTSPAVVTPETTMPKPSSPTQTPDVIIPSQSVEPADLVPATSVPTMQEPASVAPPNNMVPPISTPAQVEPEVTVPPTTTPTVVTPKSTKKPATINKFRPSY